MPWFKMEQQFRRSNTNLSCNKTRRLLDIFQRDPATVKRWIRCTSSALAGFPSSEWDALIKGESVDIDLVFSSLHFIHHVDKSVRHVGSTEIQFGRPKPTAEAEMSGQWTAAFNLIVKATAFLFPTGMRSSGSMETTSKSLSWQSCSPSTRNCSSTMPQSGTKLDKDRTFSLPIEEPLQGTTKQSLPLMVLELRARAEEERCIRERAENLEKDLISAIVSMEQMDAVSPLTNASTNTSARNASNVDMERWTAKLRRQCEELGRQPCYLRHNIYRGDEQVSRSCAKWTEVMHPLATIPHVELSNILANDTINHLPHLFEVSTPINSDRLETLLEHHPNLPFVKSVLDGLWKGVWPWADTHFGLS